MVRVVVVFAHAAAGGSVRFMADGKPIAGCTRIRANRSSGQAVCETRFYTAGVVKLQAVYSGAAGSAPAHSRVVKELVMWSVKLMGKPRVVGGVVVSKLACATASGGCRVTAILNVASAPAASFGQRGNGQPSVVSQRRLQVSAGKVVTLTLALDSLGRALLAKRGQLPVELRIFVTLASHRVAVSTSNLTMRT